MVWTAGALVVALGIKVNLLVVLLVLGVEVLVEVFVEVELEVVGVVLVVVELEVVGVLVVVLVLVLVVVDFVVCFEKQLFGEAIPQTTLLSKEHSFLPRKILNNPSIPQLVPQEFTTSQYLYPFSSPQPITLTACQPWNVAVGVT